MRKLAATDANNVNVINDIESQNQPTRKEEISNEPYTSFVDKDGNGFADAQSCVDYINEKANVIGLTGDGIDLALQTICFTLDETNTSIMMDNGYAFGVNTIKAVEESGLIKIVSNNTDGTITHFYGLDHTLICVNGKSVSGGLNDVINTLNELFTVGAFQAVVITDPYSTMIADVGGVSVTGSLEGDAIDPSGSDIGAGLSSHYNRYGYKSTETINQAGEYFSFNMRNEGIFGACLILNDVADVQGSATYGDPTRFCDGTVNSGHYGIQWGMFFHPSPDGPWTYYGADTRTSMRNGWTGVDAFRYSNDGENWLLGNPEEFRIGLDENSFIHMDYYDNDTSTWIVVARTSYPIRDGVQFHLGIKFCDSIVRLTDIPKVHLLDPVAPTLYPRWIESPDTNYNWPLFATKEEADYYDSVTGGSGNSHVHVYEDEPTTSNWYMPDSEDGHNLSAPPDGTETLLGNLLTFTEITSLKNEDLKPAAFSGSDLTVNELSPVNQQLHPAGADFTTSIVDDGGSGLHLDSEGIHLVGTSPEVSGDYVANPSDTYTLTIRRDRPPYGHTDGTYNVIVNNLTAPTETVDGFQQHTGSIVGGLMQDGSVYQLQHQGQDPVSGERVIFVNDWVSNNVLPYLLGAGDKYIVGVLNGTHDTSTLEVTDFDFAIVWEYVDDNSHRFYFVRDGVVMTGGGTAGVSTKNIVVNSKTSAIYDFAIELDGTSAWLIACNVNSIMNEPSPNDGGAFSHYSEVTNYDQGHTGIHFGVISMEGGLDEGTSDISVITTPTAPVGTTTPFNYALDFSGSSEHMAQVNTHYGYNPIMVSGWSNIVAAPTVGQTVTNGHPWATAVVFKVDGHSSNQHIWNLGEGAGSTDDNIYLRVDANRNLYFGWGRDGARNELFFASLSTTTWYGCYIGFNGTRLSGADATAANLADVFDVRLFSDVTNWQSASAPNNSTTTMWGLSQSSTGGRMDRQFTGSMTIGGRAANRSFHGKVASMLITTLKNNVAMPDATEIELMITNPIKWVEDYKIGNSYRRPNFSTTDGTNFQLNNSASAYATQLLLNGDGVLDSFANGIRNYINTSDQNFTRFQLNSMVSNDFENVNINGLT